VRSGPPNFGDRLAPVVSGVARPWRHASRPVGWSSSRASPRTSWIASGRCSPCPAPWASVLRLAAAPPARGPQRPPHQPHRPRARRGRRPFEVYRPSHRRGPHAEAGRSRSPAYSSRSPGDLDRRRHLIPTRDRRRVPRCPGLRIRQPDRPRWRLAPPSPPPGSRGAHACAPEGLAGPPRPSPTRSPARSDRGRRRRPSQPQVELMGQA
jgi:hypothetical protein